MTASELRRAREQLAIAEVAYRTAVLRHARSIINLDQARRIVEAIEQREDDRRERA